MLRLEDLDQSRCRPEHVQRILRDLTWLGLDWDGAPLSQSQRVEALREAAARLEQAAVAYRCICTRADLEQSVQAPQRGVSELRYPGTCRDRELKPGERMLPMRGEIVRLGNRRAQPQRIDLLGQQSVESPAKVGGEARYRISLVRIR